MGLALTFLSLTPGVPVGASPGVTPHCYSLYFMLLWTECPLSQIHIAYSLLLSSTSCENGDYCPFSIIAIPKTLRMLILPNYNSNHHPSLYLAKLPMALQNSKIHAYLGCWSGLWGADFHWGATLSSGQRKKTPVTQFSWACTHRWPWSQKKDTWGVATEQEPRLSWSIHTCYGKIYQTLEWQADTFHLDLISWACAQKEPHPWTL